MPNSTNHVQKSFEGTYANTELVIALVGAVGTPHKHVVDELTERLKTFGYKTIEIRVSQDVIKVLYNDIPEDFPSELDRITTYIDHGNMARAESKDNSILALGVCARIFKDRDKDEQGNVKRRERTAYVINSLKHPEEVKRLRRIYTDGFYLIGIYSDETHRCEYLFRDKQLDKEKAKQLIKRDADEIEGYGQHTRDTFHLADFFIHWNHNQDQFKKSIWRALDLIFGHPYITPNFDEYAMFMAFTSALRSSDLSRQIGAVIARNNEIIATGANDCPKAGGGLYWPEYDKTKNEYVDISNGRDYTRGQDSNRIEQQKIIDDILRNLDASIDKSSVKKALSKSKISDLTEYGRVVHAEMEALLFCARNTVSARSATLYTTTFPCHNCAKHIISAGITRVVYVEPYPKSKAFDFHDDSIKPKDSTNSDKVVFEPFVGVGPRKFFDLFSMRLSSGSELIRKSEDGHTLPWECKKGSARIQMLPCSYLDIETFATRQFAKHKENLEEKNEQRTI